MKGRERDKKNLVLLIFAVFDLLPIFWLLFAVYVFWESGSSDAKNGKFYSQAFRMTEICCESYPQAALQLYIASQQNRLDALLIISIVSSLISVILGIVKTFSLIVAEGDVDDEFKDKETFVTCFLLPWVFLSTLSFVPSVCFYSSMKNHGSSGYMSFL